MIGRGRLILVFIGTSIFASGAYADMVPVLKLKAEYQQSLGVSGRREVQHTNLSSPYDDPFVFDLNLGTIQLQPEARADIGQPSQMPHTINLTGGPGSVSLCLYALMGLGLCSAPHWMKRLSLSHIPEWYHDGGPFQIGHSFAVPPESLCPVPVYCFVQPDDRAERFIPQYRLRTVVSLWRKSQFTPDVIASRGPPNMP